MFWTERTRGPPKQLRTLYGVRSNSAHAAFGGSKQSGIVRETHKMMLDHYQSTKNLLVSYSPKKLGFF
ncbi:hypothetical protein HYE82_13935 [Streptomyces sp. BR123]|uniref:hypothetical protein n=1 Tax=Streptomyces sp. BR123 TaxID=2749828 RepID=UPI0015C4DD22|nr:hypothetical protein [Streptomyces sp. BR123]NXY95469.1 hypothetical protein [Streptomyces sp. BR123]